VHCLLPLHCPRLAVCFHTGGPAWHDRIYTPIQPECAFFPKYSTSTKSMSVTMMHLEVRAPFPPFTLVRTQNEFGGTSAIIECIPTPHTFAPSMTGNVQEHLLIPWPEGIMPPYNTSPKGTCKKYKVSHPSSSDTSIFSITSDKFGFSFGLPYSPASITPPQTFTPSHVQLTAPKELNRALPPGGQEGTHRVRSKAFS
jgi:hypothetical protein